METVVAMISGGKDSIYAIQCCFNLGHNVIAVAHLAPKDGALETDSYMYQSIGSRHISYVADALCLPLVSRAITGFPKVVNTLDYSEDSEDEVQDMFELLKIVKWQYPSVTAVCCGAIFSVYQKLRFEFVCRKLSLTVLMPLWMKPQRNLLRCMLESGINAVLVKTACMGLDERHIAKSLSSLENYFHQLEDDFGFNVCGEGGEYETFVLDSPIFRKSITVSSWDVKKHCNDPFSPVLLASAASIELVKKSGRQQTH